MRYGSGRITDDEIREHLVKKKELYEFGRKIEAKEALKKITDKGTR